MRRSSIVLLLALAALAAVACKGPPPTQASAQPTPLLIASEDVYTVRNTAQSAGPAITGSIQPERKADVRAEVPAIVLRVMKENGDQVRRGELLVQLDDTALRDALMSTEAAARSGQQALDQA